MGQRNEELGIKCDVIVVVGGVPGHISRGGLGKAKHPLANPHSYCIYGSGRPHNHSYTQCCSLTCVYANAGA